ncbi:TlpA disulfide reductase family protein [Pelomonas sp. SE-A7]|uniref:TlpA family protein disulfide reductase n=1 Tax=Pelomonas sp. SE-A7 TaxID=3054953 RepID=UPI00259C7E8E|nr:TlpA disulfide reductase family protein [Pelomonas sp. SE-A7]MDM4765601.1 TlpA disulfide reductase family protein [Pelomonas sp. SE-A7]
MLKSFSISSNAKISYKDAQGNDSSYSQLMAHMKAGKSVAIMKKDGGRTFEFRMSDQTAEMVKSELEGHAASFKVKPGQLLPDFKLTGLNGASFDKSALTGRYSVISFFFEACTPCIAEVPALNKFRELHPELNLLAVTIDDKSAAQRYVDRYKLNWPIAIEGKSFNESIGVKSYPSFAVLDPKGRLLGYRVLGKDPTADEAAGRAEHGELAAWVKELVAKNGG